MASILGVLGAAWFIAQIVGHVGSWLIEFVDRQMDIHKSNKEGGSGS